MRDNLPKVLVNGKEAGYPGYFIVKLPVFDPRAYVLGHITNCCQSIGGYSEPCVIEGIIKENNGFYVLLKGSEAFSVLENDAIDYSKYHIVVQGYAWLSSDSRLNCMAA